MGIAGVGTYNSTSFYYAMRSRGKNSSSDENSFGLMNKEDSEQTGVSSATNNGIVE